MTQHTIPLNKLNAMHHGAENGEFSRRQLREHAEILNTTALMSPDEEVKLLAMLFMIRFIPEDLAEDTLESFANINRTSVVYNRLQNRFTPVILKTATNDQQQLYLWLFSNGERGSIPTPVCNRRKKRPGGNCSSCSDCSSCSNDD
ncbi:MAG: hypothetical protein PHC51_03815 [bacterium]|nr:hypothetical protein [bacterium]